MSDGFSGIGVVFGRSADGTTYTPIANVFGITGPSASRDTIEITTVDSVNGYKEKIGGLRDGGQFNFSLNFTYANYVIFKNDFESDDPVYYQLILPDTDTTTLEFQGLVTGIPLNIPETDRVTIDVTIEISGQVNDTTV